VGSFHPKLMLKKHEGRTIGGDAVSKRSLSNANRVWMGGSREFKPRGQSGLWVSELLPHLTQVAAPLCVVRSMSGELPLHGRQSLLPQTGPSLDRHPVLARGYSGLRTKNQNLAGCVLLNNDWVPNGGLENFGTSFLPANHQATMMVAKAVPVDHVTPGDAPAIQSIKLALLAAQNIAFAGKGSDELPARGSG
jgi:hypothetical protein